MADMIEFDLDLKCIQSVVGSIDSLILTKIADAEDLRVTRNMIAKATKGRDIPLLVTIEKPSALLDLKKLCRAGENLVGLIVWINSFFCVVWCRRLLCRDRGLP